MALDEHDGSSARPRLVRAYALTSGRTTPAVHLPLEATIELRPSAQKRSWPAGDMPSMIIELCRTPQSVAEISARLSIPLGVARVLVGDLVAEGHVATRATMSDSTTDAERRDLIERTLSGLRAL